jgi:sRNA-binding carbon storage regulator CsrA
MLALTLKRKNQLELQTSDGTIIVALSDTRTTDNVRITISAPRSVKITRTAKTITRETGRCL